MFEPASDTARQAGQLNELAEALALVAARLQALHAASFAPVHAQPLRDYRAAALPIASVSVQSGPILGHFGDD
jgi:hypothetical protein